MKLLNYEELPDELKVSFLGKANTHYLSRGTDAEKLRINIDKIQPGNKSCKYHSHSKQEEFFVILKGQGILKFDGKEYLIKENDFFSKPAGKGLAHYFFNNSEEVLEVLDISTIVEGDVVYYPDDEVYFIVDEDLIVNKKDHIESWSFEPN